MQTLIQKRGLPRGKSWLGPPAGPMNLRSDSGDSPNRRICRQLVRGRPGGRIRREDGDSVRKSECATAWHLKRRVMVIGLIDFSRNHGERSDQSDVRSGNSSTLIATRSHIFYIQLVVYFRELPHPGILLSAWKDGCAHKPVEGSSPEFQASSNEDHFGNQSPYNGALRMKTTWQ